jgi:hypothetical protein
MLSGILLSGAALYLPLCYCAECRYAECLYAECRYFECGSAGTGHHESVHFNRCLWVEQTRAANFIKLFCRNLRCYLHIALSFRMVNILTNNDKGTGSTRAP